MRLIHLLKAVSDAYENVIPKLSANLGSEFQDNLIKIMRENRGLSNEALGQFNRGLQVIFRKLVKTILLARL